MNSTSVTSPRWLPPSGLSGWGKISSARTSVTVFASLSAASRCCVRDRQRWRRSPTRVCACPSWRLSRRGRPRIPVASRERTARPPEGGERNDDPLGERRDTGSDQRQRWHRSEEHTSELQSLMRTSYAVFCLKKKNTDKTQQQ